MGAGVMRIRTLHHGAPLDAFRWQEPLDHFLRADWSSALIESQFGHVIPGDAKQSSALLLRPQSGIIPSSDPAASAGEAVLAAEFLLRRRPALGEKLHVIAGAIPVAAAIYVALVKSQIAQTLRY